jgi:predicted ATP-grasp superfamily ATP-dependent carboligase
MKKVLVTDGRSRASLAIVRSLGKKGINVTSSDAFDCPSFYSKYSSNHFIYSLPNLMPDEFVSDLINVLSSESYDALIPVRDDSTLLLSKNKANFERYVNIPVSNYDTLCLARDKSQTIKFAQNNNIPCPITYFPTSYDDLSNMEHDLEYPLVIKPCESSGSRGIKVVYSFEELLLEYMEITSKYGSVILQEFIPHGGAYGVSMLLNNGDPRAVFAHKRLREYPSSGGPSTLRESVSYPEIEEYAIKLLKGLNWHGVAMVEFRIDSRTNEPKLMEINPRFWGSLQLAISSGVDFPYMLYEMACNGDVDSVSNYKLGVQSRWFLPGDILWYLSTKNKIQNASSFFRFRGFNYDIVSWDDPMPTIGMIKYGFVSLFKKQRVKHVFNRGW